MGAASFISRKLRFKGKVSVWATAISSFVMIVAVSIASGFKAEMRKAIGQTCADVVLSSEAPIRLDSALTSGIKAVEGVVSVNGVISQAGILKSGDVLEGVLFKGVEDGGNSLEHRIPERHSRILGKTEGDKITAYFISGKVKARNFTIAQVYSSPVELDRNFVVYCPLGDLRRVQGLGADEVQNVEVRLDGRFSDRDALDYKAAEIGMETGLYAQSSARMYRSIFDWLQVIDTNVIAILVLMSLVAAFNMISGLLIMIMRSTTTIGTLKALGMDKRNIALTFLKVASRSTLLGLLAGNAVALLFCLIQGTTHFLKLDPSFYFVSYLPLKVNLPAILATDLAVWALTLLLMLIPSGMISRIDAARSIKGDTI